ncbi:hypothetical protein [Marinobacter panjinensis]|uniref:hypothetical protein n=1 Tax=Marinobacter panjinensis TaxID=2576384 RepID=UPI0014854214|nr:hypothetical protein [Marinobacter panjinensis]MCR8914326.1 hypothetical protein [Marinobacter panjinensis]
MTHDIDKLDSLGFFSYIVKTEKPGLILYTLVFCLGLALSKMVFSNLLGLLFFGVISPFQKISIKRELSNSYDENDIRLNPETK